MELSKEQKIVEEVSVSEMTHEELTDRAVRWLRNSARIEPPYGPHVVYKRCGVVLSEVYSTGETPDAIGWFHSGRGSILIECKTSRSDYYTDKNKSWRQHPHLGMGQYRYYMTPKGLLVADRLPEKWGLLEVKGKRVSIVKYPERFDEYHRTEEVALLYSECRKIQIVELGGALNQTRAGERITNSLHSGVLSNAKDEN